MRIILPLLLCSALATLACSSGNGQTPEATAGSANFAVLGVVYGDDVTNSYVSLLESLDVQKIDYSRALEISGAASISAYGGWLFVADADDLTITRYATDSGTFVQDGVMSLTNLDIDDLQVDDFANTFVDAHKAYLVAASASTIIWDPTKLEVTGEIATPDFVREPPFDLDFGPGILRDGKVVRAVTWRNFDEGLTASEQYLSSIDTKTDELGAMVSETRCPGLTSRVTEDEAGNLYFSSWFNTVAEALVLGKPSPCALRLNAGEDGFDASWQLGFSDVANDHQGAALNYLEDGDAFMSIFHEDRAGIDETTTVADLDESANWRFWGIDLEKAEAAPLAGLDWLGSRSFTAKAAGRTFVIVPAADISSTTVYEVTRAGAEPRFDIQGFSHQLLQLR